jgi:hypothetical protein
MDRTAEEFVHQLPNGRWFVGDFVCDGRTLGLFTSYRNLNAVYERLDGREHRVLRQGELPRAELT